MFDDNFIFFFYGLVLLLAALAGWLLRIEFRFRRMFRGRGVKDLESALSGFSKEMDTIQKWAETTHDSVKNLEKELKNSARHIGMIRFNPYKDAGGDQSFAISILDDNKNGFVVSSIYGRDSNRIYAKPIIGGTSKYQLSGEEKEAVLKASKNENNVFASE